MEKQVDPNADFKNKEVFNLRNVSKHVTIFAVVLILACLIAVGCNPEEGKDKDEEVLTLSLGTEAVEGTLYYSQLEYIANELPKRTDGRIKGSIYPGQELGSEVEMMEGVRSGSVDACIAGGANLASFVPEFQLLSVPFIFKDYDSYVKAMKPDSEVWKALVKAVDMEDIGMKLVAPATIGSRWFINSKGEVRTPDDIKKLGLKIRVQANPIENKVWTEFGGTPVHMPMPEVFTAIQQGVCHGAENAPDLLYHYKIYEVAKYLSRTEHSWYVATLVLSEKTWDKIPEDLRPVVMEVFEESGQFVIDAVPEFEDKAVSKLRKEDIVIVEDVDKEAFREKIMDLYDEVAEESGAEEIWAAIKNLD